ncbi:MAG: DUF368 domain-containing protein [Spirochaetaceae bacterium]|nr:DUF368 domain-containing protein [Spirochaetaceae bacterium]
MIEKVKLLVAGAIIGIANVIPGVSGGTLAVVFNIYDKILAVITPNIRKLFAQWKFWLPLGIGIIIGILGFSNILSFLFKDYPTQTKAFFTGLIIGSLPLIYKKMYPVNKKRPALSAVLCALATLILMILLFLNKDLSPRQLSTINYGAFFYLTAAGMIAAVTMIIPGISGSFLLVAMGIYQLIIDSISNFTRIIISFITGGIGLPVFFSQIKTPFFVLVPVCLGIVIGLFFGAALVRLLMRYLHCQTYGAIFGLIAGSVFVIVPTRWDSGVMPVILTVLCFFAGIAITICFAAAEKKNNREAIP